MKKQTAKLSIHSVMPRFCFNCGTKLKEVGLGWLQCQNEQCGEVYLPFIDEDNNQCLMHQRTSLSPTVVCNCLSEEFVENFTSDGELTPIDIVAEITGLNYDEIRSSSKIVRVSVPNTI